MVSFFHAYDLRGKYPREIGEEEAEKVGKAFGTWTGSGKVLVGRDGRTHGEEVEEAFIRGLRDTGTDVLDAGMVPTPAVYRGMLSEDVDASAVVTASHNPPEYTGFKFSTGEARALSRDGGMERIEELYESGEFDEGEGKVEEIDILESYVEFVAERVDLVQDIDVVVNYGNGVTAEAGGKMLEELGSDVREINSAVDGSFPAHPPDPGNEEAQRQLKEAMTGEDLGILFDGDGDRAGFILPEYGYVPPDEVLALFSGECLQEEKGKVVHDLRASKLVKEKVRENGGKPEEC
ncbi:MAG: hypothetical protein ABEJ91_03545, partial [Candidatus Nanohaloarchaea archaeon]